MAKIYLIVNEIIRYGVEGILNNLLGIFITLMLVSFVIVYLKVACFGFSLTLRKHAGGFHAKTKFRCLMMSVVLLFLAFEFH
ncbi:MAG: accessory gene regulator B family protein [[Clostridium] nexile]